ncbi:uncharacterized protein LOC144421999 [Styela clava]
MSNQVLVSDCRKYSFSDIASGRTDCPWFEIEFSSKVAISEILIRGMEMKNELSEYCLIQSFILIYDDGVKTRFYQSKDQGQFSAKMFFNQNEREYNKHTLSNVFANKIKIIAISWKKRPCSVLTVKGCSYKKMFASFYKTIKNGQTNKFFTANFNCKGSETSLKECGVENKIEKELPIIPMPFSCQSKYRLRSPVKDNIGYLQRWNSAEKLWKPISKYSKMINSSESILYWSMANQFSEYDEQKICIEMGFTKNKDTKMKINEIDLQDIIVISSMSFLVTEDVETGKLMVYSPNQASNKDINSYENRLYAWCPMRYGDFINIELRRIFQVFGVKVTVLGLSEFQKLELENGITSISVHIQYSVNGDTWINMQEEDLGYKFENSELLIIFKKSASAKFVRITITKSPVGQRCIQLRIIGHAIIHNWQNRDHCIENLGMGDGRIQNESITASSILNKKFEAYYGRIDNMQSSINNGWACLCMNNFQGEEWIQVKLSQKNIVRGIVTQGSVHGNYFVESFKLAYSDERTDWTYVKKNDGKDKAIEYPIILLNIAKIYSI